ncbi:T9SS C-terminal target domain-containing protein [Dysgonomonas sp. 216]|uniref:alginate lyase family protein n=1 Tax=Dysgonomonas sp. 216 TaxID=2302934 RepID=UPI0013D0D35B|nr:alginate lyase family protein [Dysgonomonas sp. 216]NDW19682.1 T9SS C-terminal target domain-containing protein [Dysgonomonas sp. 216]
MRRILINLFVLGALLVAHPYISLGQTFIHPGGLVTQEDIDRTQFLLNLEKDPTIIAAYNKLKANGHASFNYSPNATAYIQRGLSGDNYGNAMNQVAAAYQNALMWRISGDTRHADCAVRILNAWARTCKAITGNTNASLASGIYGYEFAQAGELLRGYSGWEEADFKAYQDWMRNLWYPRVMYFLENRHGTIPNHYWANWGLCNTLALISIGILCDDVSIYNQGLSFYKDDKIGTFTDQLEADEKVHGRGYNEFLGNNVVWMHPDPRGPFGFLGQMQESGRDQGHTLMETGLSVDICQTAWNQGDDLYAYMNNRIAAGIEYVALTNTLETDEQVADSVPFITYVKYSAEAGEKTVMGIGGRGAGRPFWDRVIAHYEGEKGISMTYSRKMRDKMGVDGGGGDYGGNSGGFDHLGFSTITNYRPKTMYPMPGRLPVTLGTKIIYGSQTINDNRINKVEKGSSITLSPSLPDGADTGGTWKWETGETTRELTFNVQKSGIYRVTYTSPNGVRSRQAFNIAVWGDCTPEPLIPSITVGDDVYQDTIIKVLPFQKFTLSIGTRDYNRGSAKWDVGATGFSLPVNNGVSKDSVFTVVHYNDGGYKTTVNFHVKMRYVTPTISVDGGDAQTTNRVLVETGQFAELKPKTGTGYDWGTYRWSTGHTSKNLVVLNIQKSQHLQVYYTLTNTSGVTTIDTLDFYVSVKKDFFQMPNGDYYIQSASDGLYLTNHNATATTKEKPLFNDKNETDTDSQIWTISKETASNADGRFKIVSKKDGNYVNEKGDFGTNPYYPEWNTYTFYALDGENLYAIQNGGKSGTKYWQTSTAGISQGADVQDGYPFLITPTVPWAEEPSVPGTNVLSYITPAYSVNGGASKYGSEITIEAGKNLRLRPIVVQGMSGGTWLWSDNSTNRQIELNNIQSGGTYSVEYTYPEADTTFVFSLTYTVKIDDTSISDITSGNRVAVYPNPVQDYLIVNIAETSSNDTQFTLYSLDGRALKTRSCQAGENKINMSGMFKGLYIGVLSSNGKNETFKIIKD